MTCKDCIHYKSIGTLCDKYIYPEQRNNEPCDFFINNDGTYENGSWHCPRCGKIVEVAGLCYECEMDLYGMRPPTKEERESVNKYIDSISVETGITIDDSWESVSK